MRSRRPMATGRYGRQIRRALLGLSALASFSAGAAPGARPVFSHRHHLGLGLELPCGQCHGPSKDGALRWPGSGHTPCNNEACHAQAFRAPDQALCLVCHTQNTPFSPNPLRRSFSQSVEWQTAFDHKKHTQRAPRCGRCHSEQSGQLGPVVPPGYLAPSHILCGACHGRLTKPGMDRCDTCHQLAPIAAATTSSEWRVTEKFDHRAHAKLVDAAPKVPQASGDRACLACHQTIADQEGTHHAGRPPMASCVSCHDGQKAFKATGFECLRCHVAATDDAGGEGTP